MTALLKQATDSHMRGDFANAENAYSQLLDADPHHADALFLHATLHAQQGKWEQAADEFHKLVSLHPTHIEGWLNLAYALEACARDELAVDCYKAALSLRPGDAQSWFRLGVVCNRMKDFVGAEAAYRHYVALEPDRIEGNFNLGSALHDQGRFREAEHQYRYVLTLDSRQVEAHRGLATIALQERRYADAVRHFQSGLLLAPDDVELLSNLGVMLQKLQRMEEAEAAFRLAIANQPGHVNAHFNLALILLLRGEFREGWKEYEWRLRIKNRLPAVFEQPEWDGSQLNGKTILIRAEQGFGDTFQFVRYAPMIKALGGRVILECQAGLKRLLLRTPGIDMIVARPGDGRPLAAFDTHLPLLSLPRVFDTTLQTIPADFPYIHPEPGLVRRWAARLGGDRRLRVGIVWAGRPTHEDDKNRSCALGHFLGLLDGADVTLYSLQKGEAGRDLQSPKAFGRVVDLEPEIDDFADTAAAIANLDLVITVDTSVAHLAGAMNKPVWVVLPYAPDFRWLESGDESSWYPSMRLFRQQKNGDWDSVFDAIKPALAQRALTRAPLDAAAGVYEEANIAALRRARVANREGRWEGAALAALMATPCAEQIEANWLLGVAELNRGLFADALSHLVNAYEAWPENPGVLCPLGIALQSMGHLDQAELCYQNALRFGNDEPEILFNLGVLRHTNGDLEHAKSYYQAALALKPDWPECMNNLGLVLLGDGLRIDAIEKFKAAIELAPASVESYVNLGNALYLEGETGDAATCFRQALSLHPDHPGAHNALGVALKAQGNLAEAAAEFKRALQLAPALIEACNNLGNTYRALGQIDAAVQQFRTAIAQNPEIASTWSNLGAALQRKGEVAGALEAFDRALRINPDFAEAHWNRALAWLLQGNYAWGWPEYEWGIRAGARPQTLRPFERWQGETLPGKTLLVTTEQGYGDAIQFARFLPLARKRVGKLVLACQPALLPLLRDCDVVDALVTNDAKDAQLPPVEAQIPLMSLPGLFGVTLADVGLPAPYIAANPDRVARIEGRVVPAAERLNIGLVWAGSAGHQDDLERSLDAQSLGVLANVPHAVFFSLQVGRDINACKAAGLPVIDLAPLIGDFADTAAIVSQLDLIVTVDTAVAHLAGAMGKPVWVLLPYAPDWRWGIEGISSPWYPTARLFRQKRRGAWSELLQEVAGALNAFYKAE